MGKEARIAILFCALITIIILIHSAIPSKNNNYSEELPLNNNTQYVSSGNTIYNININQFYKSPLTYTKSMKVNAMMMGFNAEIPKNGVNVYVKPVSANINIQTGVTPK